MMDAGLRGDVFMIDQRKAAISFAAALAVVPGIALAAPGHSVSLAHTGVMNAGDMAQTTLPVDQVTTVNGVEAACTGFGLDAREDPRWQAYTVRVEFSGAYNQYVPAGLLVVKDAKHVPLLNLRCDAPWLLLKLEPGKYRIAGMIAGHKHPQSWVMRLKPNRTHPRRIVLHFGDIGGAEP
jgi:hypothetical protein